MPAPVTILVMPAVAEVSAALTMIASTPWAMKFWTWLTWRPTSPCASSNWRLTSFSPLACSCMASRIFTRNRCSERDMLTPMLTVLAAAGVAASRVAAQAVRRWYFMTVASSEG